MEISDGLIITNFLKDHLRERGHMTREDIHIRLLVIRWWRSLMVTVVQQELHLHKLTWSESVLVSGQGRLPRTRREILHSVSRMSVDSLQPYWYDLRSTEPWIILAFDGHRRQLCWHFTFHISSDIAEAGHVRQDSQLTTKQNNH